MTEHEYKVGDKVALNCTKEEFIEEVIEGDTIYMYCFNRGYAVVIGVTLRGSVVFEGGGVGLTPNELKYIKPFVEKRASQEEEEEVAFFTPKPKTFNIPFTEKELKTIATLVGMVHANPEAEDIYELIDLTVDLSDLDKEFDKVNLKQCIFEDGSHKLPIEGLNMQENGYVLEIK